MKNNYLISGIPITDTAEGKTILDISLEDVNISEDRSDIIAGKVTAKAIGYTHNEEINPLVFEGSDVSLTGAGGGSGISPFLPISLKIKKQGEVTINQVVTNIISDIENPASDHAALVYPVLDCSELTEEYQDFNGYLPYIFTDMEETTFVAIYTEYVLQFLSPSNVSYPITWVETENITETSNTGFSIVDVSLPISATIIVHD